MPRTFGILILLLNLLPSLVYASCNNDSDCNNPYGHCQHGQCFCSYFHSGENCNNDWKEDKKFSIAFWIYDAIVLLAHFVFVALFSYQLYVTFQYAEKGGWTIWNVPTVALVCETIGSLARVVLFSGDPQGYREIYPFELVEVLFTISLLLYLNAAMLLLLNLIELMDQKGIDRLSFLRKYRWVFISFSFATTVATTLIALWRVTSNLSEASVQAYNLTFGAALLIVVAVDIVLGVTVFRELKLSHQIASQLSGSDIKVFLATLFRFNLITTVTIIFGIAALVVYTTERGDTNKWAWLALNAIFRTVEVELLHQFYVLVRKRIPQESEGYELARTRAGTLDTGLP